MNRFIRSLLSTMFIFSGLMLAIPIAAYAQTPEAPVCMFGVEIEHIGMAMPADTDGRVLVAARLTIAPEGGFDPHTHPGTLTVYVDSGSFSFTQLDEMEMTLNRADGNTVPMVANEEMTLGAGDWLAEDEGMMHEAWNRTDEPVVVILSGLIDPTLPLVQCTD